MADDEVKSKGKASKRKNNEDCGPSKKRTKDRKTEDNSDDDDFNLTQQADFDVQTREADIGIIERISMKNFMCHSRLDVRLGPHVNFVVGRNGSGKSAIVTALVVGLGGKASVTSRGTTIKSFIKNGKQTAELEIHLRNRGADAYKPTEYGNTIIVERKFTKDGGSGYKIKSKDGKIISSKREDLNCILDQFNIQVDNPVSILNQDTSRHFLNSKSPHDKYKFFLKATQLEQMKADYQTADQHREVTKEVIEKKEQMLPKLEKEVLEWEQKFKSLTAIDDLKRKIDRLKEDMAWAFVIEKEKGLQPLVREHDSEKARMPRFEQKVEEAKENVNKYVNQQKCIQEQLKAASEDVSLLRPKYEELKEVLGQKKKFARNSLDDFKRVENTLKKNLREKCALEARIKELQKSAQHDYEAERRGREEKIEKLMEQIKGLQAQQHTTEHQNEQFRSAVTKYKADMYEINQEFQALKSNEARKSKTLQSLHAAKNDKYKRFGAYVPAVLKSIDEHCRKGAFHQRPRGPIGACFHLKDQKWALPVERCLGNLISSFCCNDHHDQKLLDSILDRHCGDRSRPSIITSKFKDKVYDTSRLRVQSDEFPAVIDVLDVEDPVIANCLIDQRSIELILLIADRKRATQVMDPELRPGPPKNCREAFTLSGDQLYCFPSLRHYSCNYDRAKFLTANVEEDIQKMEEELNGIRSDLEKNRQKQRNLNIEISKNENEGKKTDTQLMKIHQKIRKFNTDVDDLKSIEDPAPVDVTTLEEEVENLKESIQAHEDQKSEKQGIYDDAQIDVEEADANFKVIEKEMRSKAEGGEPLRDDLGKVQAEIEQAKSHKKHYEMKYKEQEKKIADLKKKIDTYKAEIQTDIEKACIVCPERRNTRRSVTNLESEINQINKRIKTEEKSRGNPEEITRRYNETKESYQKIRREVRQCRTFIEFLHESLEMRKIRYSFIRHSRCWRSKMTFIQVLASRNYTGRMIVNHATLEIQLNRLEKVMIQRQQQYYEFRRFIAMRAKYFFIVLLSNRQYTGKMMFSHPKETLEMSVQPPTAEGEINRDMRSLSGGERSFATVCFILALWDAMESPFRCLDEFDVFMDMINRRISMDMMMHVAQSQKHKQFIFLTPQNMSQLGISIPDLHIFRMPDPDRGQGTLPFETVNRQQEDEDED
ncbi:structural maintenance of chromosomes protein 6-like isoform X4 [Mytilus californianus]|uniref:structural maintenance of chromosomes protein 6-like isoform X4 n=1 Tax=Mytilus californianus TaxID=6549 RepID=UPI0022453590|nr:structural maintenance of chromosomes protein 6-like isoform X4 [Mytilus californianus]